MTTNFRFPKFRYIRRNLKTTRDKHMVPGKDVGNFVIYFRSNKKQAITSSIQWHHFNELG